MEISEKNVFYHIQIEWKMAMEDYKRHPRLRAILELYHFIAMINLNHELMGEVALLANISIELENMEFQRKRPTEDSIKQLKYLLDLLAHNNDMELKAVTLWPIHLGIDYDLLNDQASSIPHGLIEDFAIRHSEKTKQITKMHNLHRLDLFLDRVFNGMYHEHFFYVPEF